MQFISNFKTYFKKNRLEIISLSLLTIIAVWLRVWNLEKVLAFAYDQGRDALIVRGMFEQLKPVLIGPTTGIEGVFIGPFFYYLLAPFYLLAGWHPGWTAVGLAAIYALSVPVLFFFIKKIFSKATAWVAAVLLCCSFYAVNFGRWLSNPAPLIPISIMMFWFAYISITNNKWLFWVGLLAGLSLQTELANAFFLCLAIGLFVLIHIRHYSINTLGKGLLGFIIPFLPQLFFNFRHENILLNGLLNSFLGDQNKTSLADVWNKRPQFMLEWLLKSLGISHSFSAAEALVILTMSLLALLILIYMWYRKNPEQSRGLLLIIFWIYIPLICYLFYTGNYGQFFDYYLISLFIPMLILFAFGLVKLADLIPIKIISVGLIVLCLLPVLKANLARADTFLDPATFGFSLQRQREAASWVLSQMGDNDRVWARPPNGLQHTYEYVLAWMSREELGKEIPVNLDTNSDTIFIIYEPDDEVVDGVAVPRNRFLDWYLPLTKSRKMIQRGMFGIIIVEKWSK